MSPFPLHTGFTVTNIVKCQFTVSELLTMMNLILSLALSNTG